MGKYRSNLPQLGEHIFLTDGGIETTLIFHEGIELPYFAAFKLLGSDEGRRTLRDYYARYAAIARHRGMGFIFESATWRASPDWAAKLGMPQAELDALNRDAQAAAQRVRDRTFADGDFRLRRPARRRLHGRCKDDRR